MVPVEGKWVEDETGRWFWPKCAECGCSYHVCLGASEHLCYGHTLVALLMEQIEAINRLGLYARAEANGWVPRNSFWLSNREQQEEMLLELAELEINYCGPDWQRRAMELIGRIKRPVD